MSNQIKILNSNDGDVLQRLFGRTIDECIEALNLLDKWKGKPMDGDAKLKPKLLTKAEAIETVMMVMGKGQNDANQFVKCLMALGVLKVEEEKVVNTLWKITIPEHGMIRVEQWSEGIVVWVDGRIVYKSWVDKR